MNCKLKRSLPHFLMPRPWGQVRVAFEAGSKYLVKAPNLPHFVGSVSDKACAKPLQPKTT